MVRWQPSDFWLFTLVPESLSQPGAEQLLDLRRLLPLMDTQFPVCLARRVRPAKKSGLLVNHIASGRLQRVIQGVNNQERPGSQRSLEVNQVVALSAFGVTSAKDTR